MESSLKEAFKEIVGDLDGVIDGADLAALTTKLGLPNELEDEVQRLDVVTFEDALQILQRHLVAEDGDVPEDLAANDTASEAPSVPEEFEEVDYSDEEDAMQAEEDPITDADVEALQHFQFDSCDPCLPNHEVWTKTLEQHQIDRTQFTKAKLRKILSKLEAGEVANFYNMNLSDAGATAIAAAMEQDDAVRDSVRELLLSKNFISPAGGAALVNSLMQPTFNSTLVKLDLAHNLLGKKSSSLTGSIGPILQQLLTANRTIQELNLSHNALRDSDIRFIAEGVGENYTLYTLDLSYNDLSAAAGESVKHMLATNGDLKELNLSWNKLSVKGTTAVLDGLKMNNVLKKINLSWTGINDAGGVLVGELIDGSTSLEAVDVSHNRIESAGAAQIALGVTKNIVIKELFCASNCFGDEGVCAVVKACRDNNSLALVDMRNCGADAQANEEVSETLKKKPKLEILYAKRWEPNFSTAKAAHHQ